MYQLTPKLNKRVSDQPHLVLYHQSTFRGLPVYSREGGLIESYLDRLYRTISEAVQKNSKTYAVRVDLRFPQHFWPGCPELLSNECLSLFIRLLGKKLEIYRKKKEQQGIRVHDVSFAYVWAREKGLDNRPHFHLLLLFNGHAFNTLGGFSNEQESLFNRINDSWCEALGIVAADGGGLVNFPQDGSSMVHRDNLHDFERVFYRASYLAKRVSKNFHEKCHVFGAGRP